jgi:aminopeptidase-like protein
MIDDAQLYLLAESLCRHPRTVQHWEVLGTLNDLAMWTGRPFVRTDVPVGTKVFDWTVLPDAENRRAYHPTLEELPAYDGPLTYAEAVIEGDPSFGFDCNLEVLLSTYTCHPQMANDNVSGMVVTAALVKWLASSPRRYTYRALFAPETIGALCWLWKYGQDAREILNDVAARKALRARIVAGYTINNCGDERAWSFVPSRKGDTLADRAARHVLGQLPKGCPTCKWTGERKMRVLYEYSPGVGRECWDPWHRSTSADQFTEYTFADRGSDERQFCAPGVDLPVASVMRSKHGTYPEYHTPNDKLGTVVTATGLGDSFRCYQRIIETIEANRTYRVTTIGEPRLDHHGLYPTSGGPDETAKIARDLCAYSDGSTDLIAIAEATGRAVWEIAPVAEKLAAVGVLRVGA